MEGRPLEHEQELIARAQRGDEDAYAEIVHAHQGIAFRTAYLLTGGTADAEDATQDAFVKAWRALGRFRAGSPFRPWLLRIVANEAHNRRRTSGRRANLALRAAQELSGDAAPSPEATRVALIVVASAIAAVAIAFAVPQARSAILHFFDIGAVKVERVNTLPRATHTTLTAGLGKPLARTDAECEAGFKARIDTATPHAPWFARRKLLATLLHNDVLLVEIAGDQSGLVKKFASGTVVGTDVNCAFALWIPGEHVLIYDRGAGDIDRVARYSGSALIWERAGITYRLEGEATEREALVDAQKITP